MPSYFDLLKYARTGLASPDMTAFDKLKALALCGGGLSPYTIIGQPPLSFKSDGTPLTSVTIEGNGQQNGTPSPQNIVPFDGTGERTGQLFDDSDVEYGKWINSNGSIQTNATYAAGYDIAVGTDTDFAIKYFGDKPYSYSMAFYDSNGDFISRVHCSSPSSSFDTFPVPEGAVSARFQVACPTSTAITSALLKSYKLVLVSGSTAPTSYIPYGWQILITCASQTTPLYLGEVSTVRKIKKLILTGEETIGSYQSLFYIQLPSDAKKESNAPICTHYSGTKIMPQENYYIRQMITGYWGGLLQALQLKDSSHDDVTKLKSFFAGQYAAGHPVTVWYVLAEPETGIVNEPLMKIGDYADELHSTDAGVSIPTAKGQNVLTVDTDLQPSEMTIKYR